YNGTGWAYYFQGSGEIQVASRSFYATAPDTFSLEMSPAEPAVLAEVLRPRTLLDLQDAAVGPDAREAVANATALFASHGRVPHLVNPGILGHLNGSLGDRRLDPSGVSLVRTGSWEANVSPTGIQGTPPVHYLAADGGFAPGGEDPVSIPWWLVGILWLVALVSLGLRARPEAGGFPLWVGALAVVGLFLAWDLRFGSITGTHLTTVDGASIGMVMALAGFQLLALLVAAGLLLAPLSLSLPRWLPPRFERWGRAGAYLAFLFLVLVLPGIVMAAGLLVARL
ncbi:MAG: hypothetical protein R3185_06745, partial [Candidatus Thermoplasmatota archaeon]|nr:hypothetical protein [Candidatus Thermoplasmatota archaeon]